MIRRLGESDRSSLLTLLSAAPHLNLYLLGNLDASGFDRDFCEFYGDVERDGRVLAVINRYMSGWTVYGEASADWCGLGRVVDQHEVKAERLQDNPGGIDSFLPFVERYVATSITEDHLMTLAADDFRPQSAPFMEMPLWVPPEMAGLLTIDCRRAIAAGLTFRPTEATVRATLEWHNTRPPDTTLRAGVAPEREASLLQAWHAQRG